MVIEEFFSEEDMPRDRRAEMDSRGRDVFIDVETWIRDARKKAFRIVKRKARRGGYSGIFYRGYSDLNPDFMDGADGVPRSYSISAIFF